MRKINKLSLARVVKALIYLDDKNMRALIFQEEKVIKLI